MTIARVALPLAAAATFDYWIPDGLPVAAGTLVRVRLARRALVGVVLEVADDSAVDPAKLQPLESLVEGCAGAAHRRARARRVRRRLLRRADRPRAGADAAPARRARSVDASPAPAPVVEAPPGEAGARCRANDAQQAACAAITARPRRLRAVRARRHHRQRQDRGLSRGGERGASRAAGRRCCWCPRSASRRSSSSAIAAALPGRPHGRRCTAAWPTASAGAHWLAARGGRGRPRRRHAARGVRAVAAPGARGRRRGARRLVQAAGRRPLLTRATWPSGARASAACRWCSARPRRRSRRSTRAARQRYRRARPAARAPCPAPDCPRIGFVPARERGAHEGLAPPLVAAIAARLARGEQSLVFVNRRGFAPSLLCACLRLAGRLPALQRAGRRPSRRGPAALPSLRPRAARCRAPVPTAATSTCCRSGHGTQRLERALAARFPGARIARIDRDSTRARGTRSRRAGAHPRAARLDILVGTQMLAKGHDFPRLTLVGVLGADNALYSADFRATERLGALLFQVAGRAGRAQLPGEVIVQTDFPAHPLYRALAAHDYDALRGGAARRAPHGRAAAVRASRAAGAPRRRRARRVDAFLAGARGRRPRSRAGAGDVEVFAPVPRRLARRAGHGARAAAGARRHRARRCSDSCRVARGGLPALPGRACAGRSTSIRWVSCDRAPGAMRRRRL